VVQVLILQALGSYSFSWIFRHRAPAMDDLGLGFVLMLIPNFVIFGISLNFWARPKPQSEKLLAFELLDDALRVRVPRVCVIDLRTEYALERFAAGPLLALRFLFRGEPPLLLMVPCGDLDVTDLPAFEEEGHWFFQRDYSVGGVPRHQEAVSEAMLSALERNAQHNRLVRLQRELSELLVQPREGAFAMRLERDADGQRVYRSGRPRAGEPGFARWLERESRVLAPGVRVTPEYALVDQAEDCAALPLGQIELVDRDGTPWLVAPGADGERFEWPAPEADWAVAVALSRA
jgi:hypothetical protein